MKESYLFDMSFNNIIFERRNQAYGAYELRRAYGKHVVLAATLATTVFLSGLGWPLLKQSNATVEGPVAKNTNKDKITIIDADRIFPPPPKMESTPPTPIVEPHQEKVKTVAHVATKVVSNDHPDDTREVPTVEQLRGAIIGTRNQEGEQAQNPNLTGIDPSTSNSGNGTGEVNTNSVYEFVADMPYFEGGEEGLLRYISRKIKYPRQAVNENIEGVVILSFVVNRTGHITDATILKGLGFGTDEEALRVINEMPPWTPGRQNGKPVAVRYTLPIRFSMKR
ncbi:energy transducer TonB [Pontibacter sp. JH31]|uniref:Energy transducer TonB n=1 Tax=Pontibacter aquaedesilientis TaxID=2766980 RepID=A0ABR7XJV4_9BACT|nr:energy transducer TonB [Pontibacter aquaedesilientis]MBD1398583.1 energy transducer TonB [Pontibacter aquaedesilientis]